MNNEMYGNSNNQFAPANSQQNANNMNLAAFYLQGQLGIPPQPYSLYSGQFAQAQLHHQIELAMVAQNAQMQAMQQAYHQHVQPQTQQNLHQTSQQVQMNAVSQLSRINALRQPLNPSSQNSKPSATSKPPSVNRHRNHMDFSLMDSDPRRRPSLISDFAALPGASTFNRFDPVERRESMSEEHMRAVGSLVSPVSDETLEKKKNALTDRLENVEKEKKSLDAQRTNLLRKKVKEMHEYEKAKDSCKEGQDEKENEDTFDDEMDPTRSLIEKIYAENRRRAAACHAKDELRVRPLKPFFLPSGYPIVQKTIENHKLVNDFLVKKLIERNRFDAIRQQFITDRYKALYEEWQKNDERYCKNAKKISRNEKNREIYERTFTEVKKAREEKEKNRSERSEEEEERRRQFSAVMPPTMLSKYDRQKIFYINLNGVVKDAAKKARSEYDDFMSFWTEEEKNIFTTQIIVYGKNFAAIAEFLERKSVKDCVWYYYLTKYRLNYKQKIKKRKKAFKNYRAPVMPRFEEIAQNITQEVNDVVVTSHNRPECYLCKRKIDSGSNPGRVLTRASYETYGIDPSQAKSTDMRVCARCQVKTSKARIALRCQVGTCSNARRKVRASRSMPVKWKAATHLQREYLMDIFSFREDITKCCTTCHKKISKKLDMLFSGLLAKEIKQWEQTSKIPVTSEDITLLQNIVAKVGINDWNSVAEKMQNEQRNFTAAQCKEQYEKVIGDKQKFKTDNIESEEEEGSDSEKGKPNSPFDHKKDSGDRGNDRSGESSVTLSADEGNNQDDYNAPSPGLSKSSPVYKPRFQGSSGTTAEDQIVVDTMPFAKEEDRADFASGANVSLLATTKCEAISANTKIGDNETSKLAELIALGNKISPTDTPSPTMPTNTVGLPHCSFSLPNQSTLRRSNDSLLTANSTSNQIPSGTKKAGDSLFAATANQKRTDSSSSSVGSGISTGDGLRGSITRGTPVLRPLSNPSIESLPEKSRSVQPIPSSPSTFSAAQLAAMSSSSQSFASSLNFAGQQKPTVPFGNAANDIASLANSFNQYNQLLNVDGSSQYAFLKLLQQQQQQNELERIRLSMLQNRGLNPNLLDFYQFSVNFPELHALLQQQGALSNEQKLFQIQLYHQLLQQNALKQGNMHQSIINPFFPGLTAAVRTPLQSLSSTSSEQQQLVQSQTPGIANTDARHKVTPSNSQLFSDLRSAEQMRKEREETAKQLDKQRQDEEARMIEQLTKAHTAEFHRLLAERPDLIAHFQKMEKLREQNNARQAGRSYQGELIQAHLRPSGVIVRGAGEDRTGGIGLVSKGAMKEFPPSVAKSSINPMPDIIAPSHLSFPPHGLIGINRPQMDLSFGAKAAAQLQSSKIQSQQSQSNHLLASELSSANQLIKRGSTLRNDSLFNHLNQRKVDSAVQENVTFHQNIRGTSTGDDRAIDFLNSTPELKRKSGIHTVCIPSVPSMHHSMAIKNPSSSQRRTLSPTITIRHPSTAMSTSVSGQSKAVSVSGTHTSPSPHLISTADRMAPRSLDGSIPPFARASSPLVVSSIQSMISPRTPMSVNSSLTSPSQTIHSSPQPSFRGITPGSPYQQPSPTLGPMSPSVNSLSRDIVPNMAFNAQSFLRPLKVSSPTSSLPPTMNKLPDEPTTDINASKQNDQAWKADEKDSKESSQKENKMEPASSINSNFEPLSPDTSDSSGPPVSAEPLGSPSQICKPLFSLINLPENESENPEAQPALLSTELVELQIDSSASLNQSIVPPTINSSSKLPPQPTYEPLSDDE